MIDYFTGIPVVIYLNKNIYQYKNLKINYLKILQKSLDKIKHFSYYFFVIAMLTLASDYDDFKYQNIARIT